MTITDQDRYLFDLRGFLVLRDVLSTDEVAAMNEAIDRHSTRPTSDQSLVVLPSHPGGVRTNPVDGGFFLWDRAFRNLIDHPRIMPYLQEWLSPSLHLETCIGICAAKGYPGQTLHFGNEPFIPWAQYVFRGRPHCGLTNVSWALTDTASGDGGFACMPGSHKANYFLPASLNLENGLPEGCIDVPVRAGDAIIFTEALTHAGLRWNADSERRILLYRYMPGHIAWESCDWPTELVDALTPEQRRLIEPSYVRKAVVENGVRVSEHMRA